MTSERTSPPRGPVASQFRSLSPAESASLSAARAGETAAPLETKKRGRGTRADKNFWSKRFFIFNTTILKFLELRGGGPAGTARLLSLSTATLQSPAVA